MNHYYPSNNHTRVVRVYDIYNNQQKDTIICNAKMTEITNYHPKQTLVQSQ